MNSRERFGESGNLVRNDPDRPAVNEVTMGANRLVVRARLPLTSFRIVRGHTIGGGTSDEALRRARRHLARRYP